MAKIDEIKAALKVDKHNLDENWEQQHQLNTTIGDLHEDSVHARDLKKQEIDEAHAELDAQFRKAAAENGEKTTETALKNQITLSPRMKKLERELIDLSAEVGRLAVLRESCRQRNDALKGLTALHGQNYFVTNAGKETRDAKERVADEVRSQGTQRFKRNRGLD